jgi:two-component system response regulator AtoC
MDLSFGQIPALEMRQQMRNSVLVVETDPEFRSELVDELGKSMEVESVSEKHEATRVLRSREVDGVVLDLEGFYGEGLALLQAIHSAYPGAPILVLSPEVQSIRAVKLMRLGASNYLPKPLELRALRKVLESELAGHRRQTVSKT